MSDIGVGMLPEESEPEPYLVFEHDDSPWWMWPLLSTVMITRDQWNARIIIVIVGILLMLLVGSLLLGIWGVLFALVTAIMASVLGYYSYKYGRTKAFEYTERGKGLP